MPVQQHNKATHMRVFQLKALCFLFGITFVLLSNHSLAQEDAPKMVYSLSGGLGIFTFNGDVGKGADVSSYSRITTGYTGALEVRFGQFVGVQAGAVMGTLSQSERSKTRNLNFSSPITQMNFKVVLYLDNDLIIPRSSMAAPFLYFGAGYLMFDPHGDLKDENGMDYYYWSDGSIRDLPETKANINTSKQLKRDYKYETQLSDSLVSYARNTITIPVGGGFRLKMSDHLNVNLAATYFITQTDFIDNLKDGGNDSYLFTYFSLQYNIFSKTKAAKEQEKEKEKYPKVDFSNIDKLDSDGDGIPDVDDRCQSTPKGIKVDRNGCPLDDDGDGVPNHLDKEAGTKKGSIVDENGVTQTDAMFAEKAKRDSLAREREVGFASNPTLDYLKDIDKKQQETKKSTPSQATNNSSKIPAALRSADGNNDGYISSDEISAAIDGFFEGGSDFTVEKINDLIDYFFEQ